MDPDSDSVDREAADREADRVIRAFFRDGRLVSIPARQGKRLFVLRELREPCFAEDRDYPEKEVNMRLALVHPDVAALRRYLVDLEADVPLERHLPAPAGRGRVGSGGGFSVREPRSTQRRRSRRRPGAWPRRRSGSSRSSRHRRGARPNDLRAGDPLEHRLPAETHPRHCLNERRDRGRTGARWDGGVRGSGRKGRPRSRPTTSASRTAWS